MPRPLIFANGNMLVGIDDHYAIRDLFYPQVGYLNHLSGHKIRTGVWISGRFSWCDEGDWQRTLDYDGETLVGNSRLESHYLGVTLHLRETVSNRSNSYVRKMTVENLTENPVEARLFFTQDTFISESDIGDTAFFHPHCDAMVHYKGRNYFLFGGRTPMGGIYEYAAGIKGFGGLEGTWRDAEDGHLGMNPIAQGSVDSTFSLRLNLPPRSQADAFYWIICGKDLEDVNRIYLNNLENGWNETIEETSRYWAGWHRRTENHLHNLPDHIRRLGMSSLTVIRSQIDNGGAIIASTDSDIMETNRANYAYMWPRDGAFVASVMARAGYHQLPQNFFRFCQAALPKDRPLLRHKYTAEGSMGATWHPWIVEGKPDSPIQEDETGLTLWGLWQYYLQSHDLEFLSAVYDGFVEPMASAMLAHRDMVTKLPLPSYDLWEERRGVHTYTTCCVIAGLRAAHELGKVIGEKNIHLFSQAADEMAEGLCEHLYDQERGVFIRQLTQIGSHLIPDKTIDSSVLHVGLLGILPPDDPRVVSTASVVEDALWINSPIGGLARYQHDYYFRRVDHLPGNPWIICTMWLAQHQIMSAKSRKDLDKPLALLEWALKRASNSGVLPEQVHPLTGEHLSVSPLTWSHSEFVKTCYDWDDRWDELVDTQ